MGNNSSSISSNVDDESPAPNDPCQNAMNSYLKCVENHKDGLSDGDECLDEAKVYKACRSEVKKTAKKTASD